MMNMNFKSWLILAVILVAFNVEIVQSESAESNGIPDNVQAERVDRNGRGIFNIPKAVDFGRFKATFHKSYKSATEELYRMKLFLWRSYEAFMSYVDYIHHRRSYYKSINDHSDWSTDELDASRNKLLSKQEYSVDQSEAVELKSVDHNDSDGKLRKKRSLPNSSQTSSNHGPGNRSDDRRTLISLARLTAKAGTSRTYDHLPVKSNHKTNKNEQTMLEQGLSWLSGTSQEVVEDEKNEVWLDHSKSGCFNEVQDQGSCGSCYAMATMAFLEWAHCNQTGQLVKFSEQFMVDCGKMTDKKLDACIGGHLIEAGEFAVNFGIELATDYPYAARKNKCFFHSKSMRERHGSWQIDLTNVAEFGVPLIESNLQRAPMIITIHEDDNLDFYGGGVYDGKGCKPNENHVVVLVGHGRENGEEYWLIRNSRGTSWGEKGYFKLNKNSDCIHPRKGFVFRSHFKWDINLNLRKSSTVKNASNK